MNLSIASRDCSARTEDKGVDTVRCFTLRVFGKMRVYGQRSADIAVSSRREIILMFFLSLKSRLTCVVKIVEPDVRHAGFLLQHLEGAGEDARLSRLAIARREYQIVMRPCW